MPRIKRIKRPARRPPPNDDSDDSPDELTTTTTTDTTSDDSEDSPDELATTTNATNDDSDDTLDELAQLRAKEAQRRARRRVVNARYRARHPERVTAQRQSYRARHPERVAAQKRRYRARHPEREAARKQRYRASHPERVAAQKRRYRAKKRKGLPLTDDDDEMAEGQTSQPRYRTRYADRIARGLAERQRTQEKRQALGPLSLTVRVDDFMQGFWDSLSPRPSATGPTERERTMEKVQALGPLSLTVRVGDFRQGFWDSLSPGQEVIIMDRASGALHPLDSSCDLWDEGKGFLDNLLQESTDVPSDDSLFDLLRDVGPWSPQESDFDLEDFVP